MKCYLSILIFSFFTLNACNQSSEGITKMNAKKFNEAVQTDNVQLIDVRTPAEFQEGHIPNAENIDYYSSDFIAEIQNLDKNKPVYVYCKSGGRSSDAAEILHENGFKEVYDLKGGITAWHNENP